MKPSLTLCLILLLVGAVRAEDKASGDLKKMEGSWSVDSQQLGDMRISEEDLKNFKPKLVVKGDAYEVFFNRMKIDGGKMKLNEKAEPKTIDSESTFGMNKGMKMKGLYEIDGDIMTVIFAQPGMDRPKGLKVEKGKPQILIVYKRMKEK